MGVELRPSQALKLLKDFSFDARHRRRGGFVGATAFHPAHDLFASLRRTLCAISPRS